MDAEFYVYEGMSSEAGEYDMVDIGQGGSMANEACGEEVPMEVVEHEDDEGYVVLSQMKDLGEPYVETSRRTDTEDLGRACVDVSERCEDIKRLDVGHAEICETMEGGNDIYQSHIDVIEERKSTGDVDEGNKSCSEVTKVQTYGECVACARQMSQKRLLTLKWENMKDDTESIQELKLYLQENAVADQKICKKCDVNLKFPCSCKGCKTKLVHRRPIKVLVKAGQLGAGKHHMLCNGCQQSVEEESVNLDYNSKSKSVVRPKSLCPMCVRWFTEKRFRKVCSGLHNSWTKCGPSCNTKKSVICVGCMKKLDAVNICTCCHRKLPTNDVIDFNGQRYDLCDYNVAAALHPRVRQKMDDHEYICKTCDKCLRGSGDKSPMMPRFAAARKSSGPGEEFLRAIREKPEFVCTCCHRWRFFRSVQRFDRSKYNFEKVTVQDALADNMRYVMKVPVYKGERCPHIHRIPYDIYDITYDEFDSDDEGSVDWTSDGLRKLDIKDDEESVNTSGSVYTVPAYMLEVEYICDTCHRYLTRKKPIVPPMACANNLKLDDVPRELKGLSTLERSLIAQRIPFMSVFIMKKYGAHYKIRGGCTNVPTRLEPIVKILPRLSSEVRYHPMKLKRKLSYKGNYMYNWVHKQRVVAALEWLMKHNPLYKDVRENKEWFEEWLSSDLQDLVIDETDGDRTGSGSTDESESDVDGDVAGYDDRTREEIEQDKRETVAKLRLHGTPWANMLQCQTLEDEVVACAPGENMHPKYMLMDPYFEEMAFPDLFPYGCGGFKSTEERRTKLNMRQYMQQRVLNVDGRFGRLVDYLFCAQYSTDIKQLQGNTYLALRLNRGKTLGGKNVNAGMLRNAEELQLLARTEQAWKVLKTVRGSPAYWQHELHQLLAMLRALGKPTFFITLSAADLHWREMLEATAAHKGKRYSLQDIRKMSIQERAENLKGNAAIAAWMFQYRVECFENKYLKHPSSPLGEVIDSVFKIEFQMRGAPHVHGLLWIKGAPRIDVDTDEVVAAFIDKHISGRCSPEGINAAYMQRMVERYQIHYHSKYCRKCHMCRFGFPQPLSPRTLIARECIDDERRRQRENEAGKILRKVADAMEELNPGDGLLDVLGRAGVSHDAYCSALIVSRRGSTVVLERGVEDICVNPYNPGILAYWGANMDLQYVVDEYSTVMYVCSYMMKSEKELGETLKNVSRECSSEPVKAQLRKIGKAFLGTRVVSAPEAAMRLMSLWYIKKTRAMRYIDANVLEKRVSLPKPLHLLEHMEDDEENIYMTSVHDRYSHRPDHLEEMCLMDFANRYDPIYRVRDNATDSDERYVEQEDEKSAQVDEEGDADAGAEVIVLKGDYGKMRKRCKATVPVVKRYKESIDAEAYYHARLLLYFPWRSEADLLGTFESYTDAYQERMSIIESHAVKYNLDEGVLDDAIDRLAEQGPPESVWDRIGPSIQEEKAAAGGVGVDVVTSTAEMDEHEKAGFDLGPQNGVGTGANKEQHMLSQLYERVARKDRMEYKQYRQLMRSLNPKQRAIVMYNRRWCKEWIRAYMKGLNLEGYRIFLSGAGGTGKSYVIQLLQRDMLHLLIPIKKPDPDQPLVLLTAPTGTAAFNIDGTTIHSTFALDTWSANQGALKGAEQKWVAENKLMHLMLLVVDEISMVGQKTFQLMSSVLGRIKNTNQDWGGSCMLAVGDLMQLDPIKQKPAYRDPTINSPGDMAPLLWDDLMFHELDEAMRQRDQPFRDMLNVIRLQPPEPGMREENMLISRVLQMGPDDPDYPVEALHVYARNMYCDVWNNLRLDALPGTVVQYVARDKTKDVHTRLVDVTFPTNPTKTGNLRQCLRLKVDARVMLTSNIDVTDGLTNGAMGTVVFLAPCGKEILVRFDNSKVGEKASRLSKHARFGGAVPIRRREASFSVGNGRPVRVSRVQFPLMLAWAVTIHKVQGATLPEIVVDMEYKKGRFQAGMAYVAFSRVRSLEGLHILHYDRRQITANQRAVREMRREGKMMIPDPPNSLISMRNLEHHMALAHVNIQGLLGKVPDICNSHELHAADVLCFTETHLESTNSIDARTLGMDGNEYDMFRLDRNRFGGGLLMFVRRRYCAVQIEADIPDACEMLVVRLSLGVGVLYMCYVYRAPKQSRKFTLKFLLSVVKNLRVAPVCIVGDMNENLLDTEDSHIINKGLVDNGFAQCVVDPTTDYGSLLDHIYTRGMRQDAVASEVVDCYYSDHDITTCVISHTLGALGVESGVTEYREKHFKAVQSSRCNIPKKLAGASSVGGCPRTPEPWVCTDGGETDVQSGVKVAGVKRKLVFDNEDGWNEERKKISHVEMKQVRFDQGQPQHPVVCADPGVEIIYVHATTPAIPVYFLPVTLRDRLEICAGLHVPINLDGGSVHVRYTGEGQCCGEGKHCKALPLKSKRAVADGDGNCLFRSLSYLLFGQQQYHLLVRRMICNYIAQPQNWFRMRPYIGEHMSGLDYLLATDMEKFAEWGTEVEIFAFAQLTGRDVVVYAYKRWLVHCSSGCPDIRSQRAFYLNNGTGRHFDPVIGVKARRVALRRKR